LRLKTPVALLNLWHEQAKTLVSIGGVAFALLLVFAQLGFMGAVSYTATNVFENLNFDLLLRSQNYVHLYEAGSLDRRVLEVARNVEGVQAVSPFWITVLSWRRLDEYGQALPDSDLQAVAILGTEPESQAFRHPEINSLIKQGLVNLPTQLIIDSFTTSKLWPK
jgi:putative ABC transport system permease protein